MSAPPLEIRMAHLEGGYEQIDRRLGAVESRLTTLDQKMETRFTGLDQKIDGARESLTSKIDGLQWRTSALVVGTWITTILAVLFHR